MAEPAAARAHALRWVSGCGLRKAMRAYLRPGGLPPRRQCRRDVRRLRLAASSHGCRYGRRDGGIRGGAAEPAVCSLALSSSSCRSAIY